MVPVRPAGHIKTDRRDATTLAALFRASERRSRSRMLPTRRCGPVAGTTSRDGGFYGERVSSSCPFCCGMDAFIHQEPSTHGHRRWLAEQRLHAAQQIGFEELIQAVEQAQSRSGKFRFAMKRLSIGGA